MEKLVIFDGHALLHRAFHAMPPLTTSSGELVNAVYGFSMMMLRALADLKPDYAAVAFDKPDPTFRHKAYTQYKANRMKSPEGLNEQLPRVREVVEAMNVPIYEMSGYEADDVIATLTRQVKDRVEVIIATGDKDSYQLVGPNVKVFAPRKSFSDTVILDERAVREKMGVEPEQIPDLKGLAGDSSDNIPGVAGIGDTGASRLLQQYGTVENLYKHLNELPERQSRILAEGAEDAVMSRNLATFDDQVPLKLDLEGSRLSHYNKAKVIELFKELEFRSLLNKLPEVSKAYEEENAGQENLFAEPGVEEEQLETERSSGEFAVVLRGMEAAGVLIDKKVLEKLKIDVDSRVESLEKEIYSVVGHEFNLNSPKQLGEVLFDELNLPTAKKGKFGRSTAVDVLVALKGAHLVIPLILQYREVFKLKSTYVDALPGLIDPKDGRVHTTYHDDVARTGRLSSTGPNLQNIPTKGDFGQEIRRAFVAPKGSVLLKADYNQIELRVMAHIASDPSLKRVFAKGEDVHATTAGWIFKKDPKKITSDERRVAKTVNFGVLYGMSAFGLSQSLGIDPKLAGEFIDRYYRKFGKVKEWQEKIKLEAYEKGYVETLGGFRRYLLELQSSSFIQRQAGERMAINMPVQGTAAEIIKEAMARLFSEFKEKKLKAQMILQVHDELVFEVPESELNEVAEIIRSRMENGFELSVPIEVELKVGLNWADMRGL
jgi:DNA polymerase I-like protein with 3'-5' exonuclease and polymerase domains/5'-3' exonuclease